MSDGSGDQKNTGFDDNAIFEALSFTASSAGSNIFGNSTPEQYLRALINGDAGEITNSPENATANIYSNHVKVLMALRQTVKYETAVLNAVEKIEEGKAIPKATPIDNTTPNHDAGADIIGTNANDYLQGTEVDNRLQGLLGDDRLDGRLGNDILIGGAGNDLLKGGSGNDLYYFEAGFGQDIIDNTGGGIDNIYFDGVGFNDIASGLMRSNDDLILKVSGTTDQLTIADFFEGGESAVGNISFASGGSISADQIFGAYGISNPNPTNVSSSQYQSTLGTMLDMMQQFDQNNMNNGYGDVI